MTASTGTKKTGLLFKALGLCLGLFVVVLALAFWPYLKMKQKKKSQNQEKGLTSFVNVQQPPTKETTMSKEDIVSAAKIVFVNDQDAAAEKFGGSCYDGGFNEGALSVPSGDPDEQAKIDAAVLAQKNLDQVVIDGLQGQLDAAIAQDASDVKDAQDAKGIADAALADLQSKLDSLTQKEGVEASVIQGLQQSKSALEQALALIASLPALPSV